MIQLLYPRWLHKINQSPTKEEYIECFISIYNHHPDKCQISIGEGGGEIVTPDEHVIDGSYIDNYTDSPNIRFSKNFYYKGSGPDWDFDIDGKRYYLINILTQKPQNWNEIKKKRLIFNYHNKKLQRELKLNKLLEK